MFQLVPKKGVSSKKKQEKEKETYQNPRDVRNVSWVATWFQSLLPVYISFSVKLWYSLVFFVIGSHAEIEYKPKIH